MDNTEHYVTIVAGQLDTLASLSYLMVTIAFYLIAQSHSSNPVSFFGLEVQKRFLLKWSFGVYVSCILYYCIILISILHLMELVSLLKMQGDASTSKAVSETLQHHSFLLNPFREFRSTSNLRFISIIYFIQRTVSTVFYLLMIFGPFVYFINRFYDQNLSLLFKGSLKSALLYIVKMFSLIPILIVVGSPLSIISVIRTQIGMTAPNYSIAFPVVLVLAIILSKVIIAGINNEPINNRPH